MNEWNQDRIQQYIDNKVEESTTLEYKSAGALDISKKKDIAKDVSAMANATGGIIVYGVSEEKHLPQEITPINRTQFTREWLDQVITHNIRPLINGITIHPVSIGTEPEHVVYVVEIPQSTTAHQVTAEKDYRYYERSNFVNNPMEDYRIRDVMNRAALLDAEVAFQLIRGFSYTNPSYYVHTLKATVMNTGLKTINHFKLRFTFPYIGLELTSADSTDFRLWDYSPEPGLIEYHVVVYRSREMLFPGDEVGVGADVTYPWCFKYTVFDEHEKWIKERQESKASLYWVLYADDTPPKRGEIAFSQLYG